MDNLNENGLRGCDIGNNRFVGEIDEKYICGRKRETERDEKI